MLTLLTLFFSALIFSILPFLNNKKICYFVQLIFIKSEMPPTETIPFTKLTFSGHDTFHCRHLWLKKGFDFINSGNKFSEESAVITLGVGKNMVSAIHYWMKAFGLLNRDGALTDFAQYIFSDNGKDPYLEDNATLWLLHYQLVKQNIASLYNLVFNELRKEKIEFSKENVLSFLERRSAEIGFTMFNAKTAASDFEVLAKMYIRNNEQSKDKEDTLSGILTDLNIIQEEKRKVNDKTITYFSIPNSDKKEIPNEVLLFTILDNESIANSVNVNSIFQDDNQAGSVFAMTRKSLTDKLEEISSDSAYSKYGFVLSDHAGIKELQFKIKPEKFSILNQYYGN